MQTSWITSSGGASPPSGAPVQGGTGGPEQLDQLKQSDQKAHRFAELKTQLKQADTARSFPALPIGVDGFDTALSGGLRFGHVHLMTGRPFDGAATGFVLALLRAMMEQDKTAPVVWCSPYHAGQAGHVLASALPALGVSPSRFIFVHDQHPKHLMGAFEEVLQTKGILAVVGEYGLFSRNGAAWQRWARRTRLAAQTGGGMGLLLGSPAAVSGFETGWHITAAPGRGSAGMSGGVSSDKPDWRPCWAVQLGYTRQGTSHTDRLLYDGLHGCLHSVKRAADQNGRDQNGPVSGVYLPAHLSA